ncbi:MAG TPA: asparagine synthase (glutamine-hydrolyzing), partial [Candidatus Limnocylindrales bacterium]|nr:asparagine synthase (glutamine-hydrolyzing) [Candidatus Limnocylindrales bacterium]
MCGLCGFAVTDRARDNASIVRRMADQIRHRGPDDDGYFVNDAVALGFRRLSIIDLATGHQPMTRRAGDLTIVFNGEIYNYRQLRAELETCGYRFETKSDTETLLHGYAEWGNDLPNHLRGMFAFVIFDGRRSELFGARDIFGIKPLYYYLDGSTFLFGSEIKAFLSHPDFQKAFNDDLLAAYLSYEYVPDARTLFRNVFKLPPGHSFRYAGGHLEIRRYHEIAYHIDPSLTLERATDEIRSRLPESVAAHMIADVEVGSFLSSGVDSSYVAFEAAKLTPLKSFSVGYDDSRWSELPASAEFARDVGIANTQCVVNADDFFGAARQVQWHMDEPLSNPSAVPLYFVAQAASEKVKVVVSGEGADELFGGYNHYRDPLAYEGYQHLPLALRRVVGSGARLLPQMKGRRFLIRGAMPYRERFSRIDYAFNEDERDRLLIDRSLNYPAAPMVGPLFDQARGLDEVSQAQYVDMATWLVYDILLKADRMSMAHSLELRVPFLDREMLDLALAMPSSTRVTPHQGKVALRRAAAADLPAITSNR